VQPQVPNGSHSHTPWVQPEQRVPIMNKDQIKGAAKDVAGKLQQKAGKLVGNEKFQAKGLAKQVAGKLQKGVGDIKDAVGDAGKIGD
jgi:uncharacterized protein YjbJ (UPF0337 family)